MVALCAEARDFSCASWYIKASDREILLLRIMGGGSEHGKY